MAPLFRHWDGLNHIYGVVEVIRDLTKDLKAVLEFEPGLYSHTQVRERNRNIVPQFPEDNDFLNWETCLSDESNKGRVPQVARHQIRMGHGEEGDGNKVSFSQENILIGPF